MSYEEIVHPGLRLKEELAKRGLSANKLSLAMRVPSGRVVQILNGKRGVSAETALRLGRALGQNPQYWIGLQSHYDLAVAARDQGERIRREVQPVEGP